MGGKSCTYVKQWGLLLYRNRVSFSISSWFKASFFSSISLQLQFVVWRLWFVMDVCFNL